MADLDLSSEPSFKPADATSELLERPQKGVLIQGQAAFFELVLRLGIPILNSDGNVRSAMLPRDAGAGASYAVSGLLPVKTHILKDFINPNSAKDWFAITFPRNGVPMKKPMLKSVAKRILTTSDSSVDDSSYLATISNEIRVLSKREIRHSNHVIALHCVSWNELPMFGRCWPQLHLQQAEMGSLKNFLQGSDIGLAAKFKLGSDIMAGLSCIHSQSVVHLDLKPENVLIFLDSAVPQDERSSGASPPVVAKLSDFGGAVILTDYKTTSLFQSRVGTIGWMSPEVDKAEPIPIQLLNKADIYSCGLLLASLFAQGLCLIPPESPAKEGSSQTSDRVWEHLRSSAGIPEIVGPYLLVALRASLAVQPADRLGLIDLALIWTLGHQVVHNCGSSNDISLIPSELKDLHHRSITLSCAANDNFQNDLSTLTRDLRGPIFVETNMNWGMPADVLSHLKAIQEWETLFDEALPSNDPEEASKLGDDPLIPDVSELSYQCPIQHLSLTCLTSSASSQTSLQRIYPVWP